MNSGKKNQNLADFDKFYFDSGNTLHYFNSFQDTLLEFNLNSSQWELDLTSVFSVLANNYIVGDNTIIKGIKRTPWLSEYNQTSITNLSIPSHGSLIMDHEEIAERFILLLKDELLHAIEKKKKIGILLSGGMDSRIVAGALYELIKNGDIEVEAVHAFTWGEENSRDYQYAKLIAKEFKWSFNHYRTQSKDLWENILISSRRGCEYSGIHLHAMPQIGKDALGLVEIMLAGSYGDSVGRAEFQGLHALKLRDMTHNWGRYAYLLSSAESRKHFGSYQNLIANYRERFGKRENWQVYEIEAQCHYMRRMLNPCMEIISENVPLYQAFTDLKFYSFVWSLDISIRNDSIYSHVLKRLNPILSELPWARTGIPYGKSGNPDGFQKKHHRYSEILNLELLDQIKDSILRNEIFSNNRSLKVLFNAMKKNQSYNFDFLEKLTYLTSLSLFFENNRDRLNVSLFDNSFVDYYLTYCNYFLKTQLRAISKRL
jgi:asparagine synthase (glutamine-hydrolysing)